MGDECQKRQVQDIFYKKERKVQKSTRIVPTIPCATMFSPTLSPETALIFHEMPVTTFGRPPAKIRFSLTKSGQTRS